MCGPAQHPAQRMAAGSTARSPRLRSASGCLAAPLLAAWLGHSPPSHPDPCISPPPLKLQLPSSKAPSSSPSAASATPWCRWAAAPRLLPLVGPVLGCAGLGCAGLGWLALPPAPGAATGAAGRCSRQFFPRVLPPLLRMLPHLPAHAALQHPPCCRRRCCCAALRRSSTPRGRSM